MKYNIKILYLLLLFSISGIAQGISTESPVLSPQTPTTSDLGKYGEVQVNESSGKISPTIPLFTYIVGNFELPLSLNYSGNGVKVNQDPTWAGVNWNINPGGLITRVVKDRPDELTDSNNRLYFSGGELDNLEGARELITPVDEHCFLNPNTKWFLTLKQMEFINADTEADIFNYNFLGYSGSFYLDKNNNVHIIKYDKEIKITFIFMNGNKSEFKVETPSGDSFYFGGLNASESSRTWVNNGAGSTANIPYTQNAFYFHTILFYNGGTINFTYENYDTSCDYYKIGIVESASTTFPDPKVPCNKTIKTLYGDIENAVRLKEISNSFTDKKLVFSSSFVGSCNRLLKLNEVSLKNNSSLIKKVKLNYLVINNEPEILSNEFSLENKFFLENVVFYDKNNQLMYNYKLIYNSPELFPPKKSFAQDHLGYYNGKNSNSTLLAKTSNNALNSSCLFNLADREADFNSSLIGTLSKIVYPTKGSTVFEYELPYKGQEDIIVNHYLSTYYNDENRNNNSLLTTTLFPANNQPLILTQAKLISLSLNAIAKGPFSHQNIIKFEVLKKVGNNWVVQELKQQQIKNTENTTVNYQENYSFSLPAGSYIFKLSLVLYAVGNNNSIVANIMLNLPQGTKPIFYLGLRVKKVLNFDSDNETEIKRYFYNSLSKINVEAHRYDPNYLFYTQIPSDYPGPANILLTVNNITSNDVNNVFYNDEGNFIYDDVTISYGGDNFENGGKQMSYYKYSNYPPEIYQTNPCFAIMLPIIVNVATNDSYLSSTLKQEIIFNKFKKKVKEKTYNYNVFDVIHTFNNINLFSYHPRNHSNFLEKCYLLYKTKSFRTRLLSIVDKEYFGINFTNEVVTTTNYTYKPDRVSLPSVIETSNSALDTTTTKLFYPSDVADLQDLTAVETASLNTLQQQYNIGALVRAENYSNGLLLSAKQVSFAPFGSKIYPQKVSSFKGSGENNLESSVDFHSYFFDKPSLLSQTDGTKTKYEYNADHQVVLKIDNYAGTSISIDADNPLVASSKSIAINKDSCYYQNLYPDSMVTSYEYDVITKNLIKITDPKCDIYTYHYDSFNRLQFVKDAQGNILSENNYHYKIQN